MLKQRNTQPKGYFSSSLKISIVLVGILLSVEVLINLLLPIVLPDAPKRQEVIIETLVHMSILIPVLYHFVYRPRTHLIKNSRDLSEELRKSQERLKENEQRYRSLFDYNSDAVYSIDLKSNFTSVNPSCTSLTGYSSEELLSMSFIPLIASVDLERALKFFEQASKGMSQSFEIAIVHKQGHWIDISVTIVPIIIDEKIVGVYGIAKDITDKKIAVTALIESNERYSKIFENNHAVMLLIDPETANIIDANPAATRYHGYSKQEFQRMKVTDLNTLTPEEVFAEMERAQKSNGWKFHFRHRLANGEIRDVDVYSGEVAINGKRLLYSIIHDISERIKAERLLKSSEERNRLLVENSPAGIITCNIDGSITNVNPAIVNMLESPSMEATKAINVLTFPPMVTCGMSADIKKCLETGERVIGEYTYTSKWGKHIYIHSHLAPLHNTCGEIIGVQGIVDDFTVRKKNEDELRTLYHALEQSPVTVVITDIKGDIEYVNPKFTQLTGYTSEEVLGQNPRILKSGEKASEEYKELWDTITSGKEWRGELHNKRKDGKLFWESASISPIFDAEGTITHFVAVKEDITERKRSEEKINYLAYHDVLTGLPNRTFFYEELEIALARAERYQQRMAVMFLDLDGFKFINDTFGHDAGDELLQEVAQLLRSIVRVGDTIARMGGDEFTLIFPQVNAASDVEVIARKILAALRQPLTERELKVTTGIGIAFYPEHGTNIEALLKRADCAMYRAKEFGKNDYQIFNG